jgi:hypothetical protein
MLLKQSDSGCFGETPNCFAENGTKITKSASSGLSGVKVLIIAIFYNPSRTITKAS